MAEQVARIEGVFTYIYNQFTVFFYGDHVYIGGLIQTKLLNH